MQQLMVPCGMSLPHVGQKLCFLSSFVLLCSLGGSRRRLGYLGSCHSRVRSGWRSWLLTLTGPSPDWQRLLRSELGDKKSTSVSWSHSDLTSTKFWKVQTWKATSLIIKLCFRLSCQPQGELELLSLVLCNPLVSCKGQWPCSDELRLHARLQIFVNRK